MTVESTLYHFPYPAFPFPSIYHRLTKDIQIKIFRVQALRFCLKNPLSERVLPGGESNAEFFSRVCGAFEKIVEGMIKSSTQTAAIVGHAGVLMAILACYGLPEAPMAHWQMEAGYGFKLRITPSLWMRANKLEVADTAPISAHG